MTSESTQSTVKYSLSLFYCYSWCFSPFSDILVDCEKTKKSCSPVACTSEHLQQQHANRKISTHCCFIPSSYFILHEHDDFFFLAQMVFIMCRWAVITRNASSVNVITDNTCNKMSSKHLEVNSQVTSILVITLFSSALRCCSMSLMHLCHWEDPKLMPWRSSKE